MITKCPTCHGSGIVGEPPWVTGNLAGYIPGKHCIVLRNKLGRVAKCVNHGLCEYCPQFHGLLDDAAKARAIVYTPGRDDG